MGQKVRRKKNRSKVKGVAIKKNNNKNSVRTVEKQYGNVTVITVEGKGENSGTKKRSDG